MDLKNDFFALIGGPTKLDYFSAIENFGFIFLISIVVALLMRLMIKSFTVVI